MAYYGVFDGHAGPKASDYTAQHLHKNIADKFPKGGLQYVVIMCSIQGIYLQNCPRGGVGGREEEKGCMWLLCGSPVLN